MSARKELIAGMPVALAAAVVVVAGLASGAQRLLWVALAPIVATSAALFVHSTLSARRAAREHQQAAWHDPVTRLPTVDRLREHIAVFLREREGAGQLTLLIFDLVGFKEYNDAYGFACGDALLRRLADKAVATVGPRGTVYRLRGAQFAVVTSIDRSGIAALGAATALALTESGEGFAVAVPADRRLYRAGPERLRGTELADQQVQSERTTMRNRPSGPGASRALATAGAREHSSPHDVTSMPTSSRRWSRRPRCETSG